MVRTVFIVVVVAFALAGCIVSNGGSGDPFDDGGALPRLVDEDGSPVADDVREAKEIALYLSGELAPPPDLSRRTYEDLRAIREQYGTLFAPIDTTGGADGPRLRPVRFHPPWTTGSISVFFDSATIGLVKAGGYAAWDDLNARFDLDRMAFYSYLPGAKLFFRTFVHPVVLAEIYAALPGVRDANGAGFYLGGPNIYPLETGGGMSYLFKDAWGDCPEGCIYSEYWYFRAVDGMVRYVGHAPEDGVATPGIPVRYPDWWDEAQRNIDFSDEGGWRSVTGGQ